MSAVRPGGTRVIGASSNHPSRLVLGTAQFGLPYGVTNMRGLLAETETARILELAWGRGITMLDTAPAYGASETVVGRYLKDFPGFSVVTKTPTFKGPSIEAADIEAVRRSLAQSIERLGRRCLDAVLVHHGDDLRKPGGDLIVRVLEDMKSERLIARVGVSVYDEAEITAVLSRFQPDIVQLPINLFDQRLLRNGVPWRLREQNIEVHARSVFLQGVLLADVESLNPYFRPYASQFFQYRQFLLDNDISALTACLAFALGKSGADRIVVGVTGHDELAQILAAVASIPGRLPSFDALACDEIDLVDPRQWSIAAA
jgi:aryl-alcohol dehydrogenase-like predicted oxidoreductase